MDDAWMTCPNCYNDVVARPVKMFDAKNWSDFNGNRTLQVSVVYEARHVCNPQPPVANHDTLPIGKT